MNKYKNRKDNIKKNRKKYITSIILLILLIITIFVFYEYIFKYYTILKDPQKIKKLILSYGKYSMLVFVMFQVIQVVFFFIPGEAVQIISGYIFGNFLGTLLSLAGIFIGSAIGYLLARYLARDKVQKIIEKRDLKIFRKVLNEGSNKKVIFLVYLIPGIPKDILVYLCGVSDVDFKDFLLYSTLGRFPWIVASSMFGSGIESKSYIFLGILSIIVVLAFAIGLLKGKTLIQRLNEQRKK